MEETMIDTVLVAVITTAGSISAGLAVLLHKANTR
jgi:hypothetical protein